MIIMKTITTVNFFRWNEGISFEWVWEVCKTVGYDNFIKMTSGVENKDDNGRFLLLTKDQMKVDKMWMEGRKTP